MNETPFTARDLIVAICIFVLVAATLIVWGTIVLDNVKAGL